METIEAFADETVLRNDENGCYRSGGQGGQIARLRRGRHAAGHIGRKLRITGEWTEHPVYGRQIKVQSLEIEQPTTLSGIEKKYLVQRHDSRRRPGDGQVASSAPSAKRRSTCSILSRKGC